MSTVQRILCVVLTLAFAGCAGNYNPATLQSLPGDIRQSLRNAVQNEHRPGVAIGLVNPNGRYFASYGVKAAGGSDAFNHQSQVDTGSVAKIFNAEILAAMMIADQISLDRELADIWPALDDPARTRLWHLATHRAGLQREIPFAALEQNSVQPLLELLGEARTLPAQWSYSNAGMALLGASLEQASGSPLPDLLQAHLTEPLGLAATGYSANAGLLAQPHRGMDNVSQSREPTPPIARGAGGLYSTTEDLLAFLAAHLAPGTAMELAHVDLVTGNTAAGHVLGWQVHVVDGKPIYHQGGDGNGYQTFIGYRPDNGVGVVLVSNSSADDDLQRIALHLLDTQVPLPSFDYPPSVEVDVEELRRYVGRYRYEGDASTVDIQLEGEKLMYTEFDNKGGLVRRERMMPSRGGGFHLRQVPVTFEFKPDSGTPTHAVVRFGGDSYRLVRQ